MPATFPLFAPAASVAAAVKASASMPPTVAAMVMLETVRRDLRVVVEALAEVRDEQFRHANEIFDCEARATARDREEAFSRMGRGDGLDDAIRALNTWLDG